MSANNLVSSRYLSAVRTASLEDGTVLQKQRPKRKEDPKRKEEPKKDGSWSASTTATVPQDACSCPATPGSRTPASPVSASAGDPSSFPVPGPALFLEVSLDRFRQIGLGRRQAHCPQDVLLCWKMCGLMGLEENVPDVFILMLFRVTKLLHRCGYHTQDIVTVAAHSIVYSVDVLAVHLGKIDWKEAANMVGLQTFIAHAYLMDEHCPLQEWHKHIFQQYCSIKVLTSTILQLMRARGYVLAVSSGLSRVHKELLAAVATYRWTGRSLLEGTRGIEDASDRSR